MMQNNIFRQNNDDDGLSQEDKNAIQNLDFIPEIYQYTKHIKPYKFQTKLFSLSTSAGDTDSETLTLKKKFYAVIFRINLWTDITAINANFSMEDILNQINFFNSAVDIRNVFEITEYATSNARGTWKLESPLVLEPETQLVIDTTQVSTTATTFKLEFSGSTFKTKLELDRLMTFNRGN